MTANSRVTINTSSLACFIFARGGSKGLPGKNIKEFLGKPLIQHAIEQALGSKYVDEVFVSTDCEVIADTALRQGATVPFLRPKELAGDNSNEWYAWRHALRWYERHTNNLVDLLVSVPTTAPLRLASDIDSCIEKYHETPCDAVITITPSHRNPSFNMVYKSNESVELISEVQTDRPFRRQDCRNSFDITTACYVVSRNFIFQNERLFDGVVCGVELPKQRAIDIDDIYDFTCAEAISRLDQGGI